VAVTAAAEVTAAEEAATSSVRPSSSSLVGLGDVRNMENAKPEALVRSFIDKFDAENQALIRAMRKVLRRRFSTAHEMAYDNYNFFVLGYSPTERPSDAIASMAAGANGVSLCFLYGATLPDPKKVLMGSGNQTRFIRLPSVEVLARPEVKALLAAAIAQARAPFRKTGRPTLVVRSISAKQRPRRRVATRAGRKK
jgi:Domain of unknown function (DU1801)